MKKRLLFVLQAVVSIGLLVLIYLRSDFRVNGWRILTSANLSWLFAGLLLAGLVQILGAARWGIFLRILNIRISNWDVLRISFVGLFFNSFLVGAVGGDAVKAIWLSAKGHRKSAAFLSVMMDRLSGLGALILCSLVLLLGRREWLAQSEIVVGVMKFLVIFLISVTSLLTLSFVMAAKGITQRLPDTFRGRKPMMEFADAYLKFVEEWRRSLLASLVSVVIMVSYFLTFYCAARAFDVVVPVFDFLSFMPAVDVISAMPVSLGGFGVREQLFVTLLGDLCGVSAAKAVSISLAGALLTMAWGMGGLALLPFYRRGTSEAVVK